LTAFEGCRGDGVFEVREDGLADVFDDMKRFGQMEEAAKRVGSEEKR
jgi:hypothetical protein